MVTCRRFFCDKPPVVSGHVKAWSPPDPAARSSRIQYHETISLQIHLTLCPCLDSRDLRALLHARPVCAHSALARPAQLRQACTCQYLFCPIVALVPLPGEDRECEEIADRPGCSGLHLLRRNARSPAGNRVQPA